MMFWGESRDCGEKAHTGVNVWTSHFPCAWQENVVKSLGFFSLCSNVSDFLQNMRIKNLNTLALTLIPPQSDLTSPGVAEVHLQPPSLPEFPFSVSEPVIYRMLQKTCISYTLNRGMAFSLYISPGYFSSWRVVLCVGYCAPIPACFELETDCS